jgi:uncharacterized protein
MAICEGAPGTFPPRSYFIKRGSHTGETCGSVFWIKFNQRLLQLNPDQEKYAAEIEKSIYNICLANQGGGNGVRYHTVLEGTKEGPQANCTCCEGQATRLYGSLPEYIYSIAPDGLYVNLYESSKISWPFGGQTVSLTMKSKFPFDSKVAIEWASPQPVAMKLRLRVPSWAANDMSIAVNGQQAAVGQPGSYVVLDRTWTSGDRISFTLPIDLRLTRYTGTDKIAGHERYALEYGPILMAATGPLDENAVATIDNDPANIKKWLKSKSEQPLCFTIDGDKDHEYMPYWLIDTQTFCIYPVIEPKSKPSSKEVAP